MPYKEVSKSAKESVLNQGKFSRAGKLWKFFFLSVKVLLNYKYISELVD